MIEASEYADEPNPRRTHYDDDRVSQMIVPDSFRQEYPGRSDKELRHMLSLRYQNRNRDDRGKIQRSQRAGHVRSEESMAQREFKRYIVSQRVAYREQVCYCLHWTKHRPRCPMDRKSRSPQHGMTPWGWQHGNGTGQNRDPSKYPLEEQFNENDFVPYDTDDEAVVAQN